ncbi:hypothetical protein TNCV_2925051 [Trichonephila clavipes]|nr:hypothetical protein TNCV_2925051 [Trichonephila clavipes]
MVSYHRLQDATSWRIIGGLEVGQSPVTCCRDLRGFRNVASTLWKQFIETGIVVRRLGQGLKGSILLFETSSNEIGLYSDTTVSQPV